MVRKDDPNFGEEERGIRPSRVCAMRHWSELNTGKKRAFGVPEVNNSNEGRMPVAQRGGDAGQNVG